MVMVLRMLVWQVDMNNDGGETPRTLAATTLPGFLAQLKEGNRSDDHGREWWSVLWVLGLR
jgi:hypothetical protein